MSSLNRVIGPVGLSLYGIGVTLGAGIYALVGEMAGAAGSWAPLAFVFAGLLAGLTGLAYAELGSRFPESAGEAVYVDNAFHRRPLTAIAGYGVALSGSISAAVILHGFAGYVRELVDIPAWLAITGALAFLLVVAAWGVRETVWMAATITVLEAAGLLLIIAVSAPDAFCAPPPEAIGAQVDVTLLGVFAASVMAFFAFIGFEDIVNMAEEVRDPQRSLPIAIITTLIVSTTLYVAVSFVAVRVMPPAELAGHGGPLVAVFERVTGQPGNTIAFIALLAMINGALVQVVMASRVLYGLAKRDLAPRFLSRIHPGRRTPVLGTLVAGVLIWALAMSGALGSLAVAASFVTLSVFALVNAALIMIRRQGADLSHAYFQAPVWVPYAGLVASLAVVIGIVGMGLTH